MNNKAQVYQKENEVKIEEIDLAQAGLEISKIDNQSLEIISQFLSFLYQVDKEITQTE